MAISIGLQVHIAEQLLTRVAKVMTVCVKVNSRIENTSTLV